MNSFVSKVCETIRSDFAKYLDLKERENTHVTRKRYMDDLDEYIENHLTSTTILEDYIDIFNKTDIRGFLTNRKTSTAKYALGNLLEFYRFNKKINAADYLDIKNELKKYKSTKKYEADFLTEEDMNFIFKELSGIESTDDVKYVLLRIMILFSYHYMFEQKHILALTWKDIDFEKRLIKNLRSFEDPLVKEWMKLDEVTYCTLIKYRDLYYSSVGDIGSDNFFYSHNRDNINSINNLFGLINDRVRFNRHISTRVGSQKLIRSKILIDLQNTNGTTLINYYRIFGLQKDTQLNSAIKEYMAREKSQMNNSFF